MIEMFLPVVFLYIAVLVKGDPSSCGSLLPTSEMNVLGEQGILFPDTDQLSDICPGFLSFSKCFQQALTDTPEDFDEETLPVYQSLDDSFGELCSEESDMKDRYLSNVECLKSVEFRWPECQNTSANVYQQYRESEVSEETLPAEMDCFKRGYSVGCMSENISSRCEEDAVAVYQLFMRKYKYISGVCQNSTAEAFKTTYLDRLNLTQIQRSIYESAFDVAS